MKVITFTQYLRPNGKKREVYIERPDDIIDLAAKIMNTGYRFEIEVLTTGHISLTIFDPAKNEDVAIELCNNGEDVPKTVDKMIRDFADRTALFTDDPEVKLRARVPGGTIEIG